MDHNLNAKIGTKMLRFGAWIYHIQRIYIVWAHLLCYGLTTLITRYHIQCSWHDKIHQNGLFSKKLHITQDNDKVGAKL